MGREGTAQSSRESAARSAAEADARELVIDEVRQLIERVPGRPGLLKSLLNVENYLATVHATLADVGTTREQFHAMIADLSFRQAEWILTRLRARAADSEYQLRREAGTDRLVQELRENLQRAGKTTADLHCSEAELVTIVDQIKSYKRERGFSEVNAQAA